MSNISLRQVQNEKLQEVHHVVLYHAGCLYGERLNAYAILAFFVFGFGMVLANVLDRYVRINWPGM